MCISDSYRLIRILKQGSKLDGCGTAFHLASLPEKAQFYFTTLKFVNLSIEIKNPSVGLEASTLLLRSWVSPSSCKICESCLWNWQSKCWIWTSNYCGCCSCCWSWYVNKHENPGAACETGASDFHFVTICCWLFNWDISNTAVF